MNLRIFLQTIFAASVFAVCGYAANGDDVLVQADFSSSEAAEFFLADSDCGRARTAFVEGESGIEFDTLRSGENWPTLLGFPKQSLAADKIWTAEFEYKILETTNSGEVYFNLEGYSKKGRIVADDFVQTEGGSGRGRISGYFDAGVRKGQFRILSRGGAKILLKSLKISSRDIPEGSEWFFSADSFLGMKVLPSSIDYIKKDEAVLRMTPEDFFPFIDRFGQYKHRDWKEKILSREDFAAKISEEQSFFKRTPDFFDRDRFGGLVDGAKKFAATGRFRLQKIDGKWWFVDPEGNLFWSFGADAVGKTCTTPVDGRENYFADISGEKYYSQGSSGHFYGKNPHRVFDFHKKNLDAKYGNFSPTEYGALAVKRMQKWGLNTLGAWTLGDIVARDEMPFTAMMSSAWKSSLEPKRKLYTFWHPFPDWFHKDFERDTKARAKKWHVKQFNSPMCLGVFIDNELPWQSDVLVLPRCVLTCPPTQPMKIAMRDFMKEKYSDDIAKLNSAWNADYADWNAFLSRDNFVPSGKSADADLLAFEEKIYERYFSVCRAAVKEISSDALYFGCRMAWCNPLLAKVASKHCDAVSFNLYRNNLAGFKLPEGCSDVPMIVGEYHICDTSFGVFGGGMRSKPTTRERIAAVDDYAVSAFENPSVVGIHWFCWFDQPASGRSDGENFACGLVDICDTPHWSLVRQMRKASSKMYKTRLGGGASVVPSNDKTSTY